jgi:hypothetical protein
MCSRGGIVTWLWRQCCCVFVSDDDERCMLAGVVFCICNAAPRCAIVVVLSVQAPIWRMNRPAEVCYSLVLVSVVFRVCAPALSSQGTCDLVWAF